LYLLAAVAHIASAFLAAVSDIAPRRQLLNA
jgi:hypothetical protein